MAASYCMFIIWLVNHTLGYMFLHPAQMATRTLERTKHKSLVADPSLFKKLLRQDSFIYVIAAVTPTLVLSTLTGSSSPGRGFSCLDLPRNVAQGLNLRPSQFKADARSLKSITLSSLIVSQTPGLLQLSAVLQGLRQRRIFCIICSFRPF